MTIHMHVGADDDDIDGSHDHSNEYHRSNGFWKSHATCDAYMRIYVSNVYACEMWNGVAK
jgi:hypothetical protein